VDKHFVLDGLNVIGTDPHTLLEDLRAFEQHVKSGKGDLAGCSLLFYGPSGTGKTHLAYHIASILDKEIVSKRGSDLLSPFVGETEARIRAAYEEAASKDAVLVVNEAESLVFNRDRAGRSWELSFTNEFLNCMEEFKGGVQIFTTNRLSDMDSAALRRFDYKLEFAYLKPDGILAFYDRFLRPLVASPLEKPLEDDLKAISCLTPSDFNVVKSKLRFRTPGEVSHEALIEAIREEARLKRIHAGEKVIGF
jgi:AAA+ superfamily predicted ATPase